MIKNNVHSIVRTQINKLTTIPKRYLLSIVLSCLMIWGSSYCIDSVYESYEKIETSHKLLLRTSELDSSVLSMETSARGYFLYTDKNLYAEYVAARDKNYKLLKECLILSTGDERATRGFIEIEKNLKDWEERIDTTINKLTGTKTQNIIILQETRKNKQGYGDRIESILSAIKDKEKDNIEKSQKENQIKKIIICSLLFVGTFSSIWALSSQAKKVSQIVEENASLSNNLLKEIEVRQDIETSLERTISLYSALLDSSLDAIIVSDADNYILEASASCKQVFGFLPTEIVGQKLVDTIVPDHLKEAHINGIKKYIEYGEGKILNKRVLSEGKRKDGSIIPIELTVVKIPTKGEILFAGFMRDLS